MEEMTVMMEEMTVMMEEMTVMMEEMTVMMEEMTVMMEEMTVMMEEMTVMDHQKSKKKLHERRRWRMDIEAAREAQPMIMRGSTTVPNSRLGVRQQFCRRSDTHFC
jgi:hypothetical protein